MDQCNPRCTEKQVDSPAETDMGVVLECKLSEAPMCPGGQNGQ